MVSQTVHVVLVVEGSAELTPADPAPAVSKKWGEETQIYVAVNNTVVMAANYLPLKSLVGGWVAIFLSPKLPELPPHKFPSSLALLVICYALALPGNSVGVEEGTEITQLPRR